MSRNATDCNMFKGTTFAARARAAELNSARAAAAAKEAMVGGGEGMPSISYPLSFPSVWCVVSLPIKNCYNHMQAGRSYGANEDLTTQRHVVDERRQW